MPFDKPEFPNGFANPFEPDESDTAPLLLTTKQPNEQTHRRFTKITITDGAPKVPPKLIAVLTSLPRRPKLTLP